MVIVWNTGAEPAYTTIVWDRLEGESDEAYVARTIERMKETHDDFKKWSIDRIIDNAELAEINAARLK